MVVATSLKLTPCVNTSSKLQKKLTANIQLKYSVFTKFNDHKIFSFFP